MNRTVIFCACSAFLGAGGAILLSRIPTVESRSVAQEPGLREPVEAPLVVPPALGPVATGAPIVSVRPAGGIDPPMAGEYTPEELVNIAVYDGVNRSVVNITTKGYQGERVLFVEVPSEGEGSGSVLDRQGHILTNFHVVDGAKQIHVALFDGNSYDARVVGQDPTTDIAVIKIEAPPQSLFPVAFGNSTTLRVGQRVYAIGNPFGLERTLSTGIISSLNRSLPSHRTAHSLKSIIQIDASINPGNSGGPLLDSHGRVIGMNTAIASKSGDSAGVGFAIPINTIARVVPQLITTGHVVRADAGIGRALLTDHGILIVTLTPGGPAERAGLQGLKVVRQQKRQGPFVFETQTVDRSAADLIVAIDGKPVKTADDFYDAIESKRPGDQVVMTVSRNGQQRQVALRLGEAVD